jgi:hypothetical protein
MRKDDLAAREPEDRLAGRERGGATAPPAQRDRRVRARKRGFVRLGMTRLFLDVRRIMRPETSSAIAGEATFRVSIGSIDICDRHLVEVRSEANNVMVVLATTIRGKQQGEGGSPKKCYLENLQQAYPFPGLQNGAGKGILALPVTFEPHFVAQLIW